MRALILLAAALLPATLPAQHAPDAALGDSIAGVVIPSIPGQPFTARVPIEWTEALAGGATITHALYLQVARDSQGRVRKAAYNIPPAAARDHAPLLEHISIYDPIIGISIRCKEDSHACIVRPYHPHPNQERVEAPVGLRPSGLRTLTRDRLGEQTMQGVRVIGTRETITTMIGAEGNDRPLVRSKTFWYSPDLQINVSLTRVDPKEGTQTLTFTDLTRTEPEAKEFAIPTSYKVFDQRQPAIAATH